jgi:hypothetical protein
MSVKEQVTTYLDGMVKEYASDVVFETADWYLRESLNTPNQTSMLNILMKK